MGLIIIFGGLAGLDVVLLLLSVVFAHNSESLNNYSEDWWEKWAGGFGLTGILLLVALLIATPATLVPQYNASINLSKKYRAYDRAVTVTKDMLIDSKEDISVDKINFGNLGKGLEGLKAKNSVYAMIEKREQTRREIQFRRENVFVFFKPKPIQ